jgi:hypothetical protein
MVLQEIRLVAKEGGRSGPWRRQERNGGEDPGPQLPDT